MNPCYAVFANLYRTIDRPNDNPIMHPLLLRIAEAIDHTICTPLASFRISSTITYNWHCACNLAVDTGHSYMEVMSSPVQKAATPTDWVVAAK